MKKAILAVIFIAIAGMAVLSGCSKDSTTNIPISLTDKDGHIFIQIDTIHNSFTAYSPVKIAIGHLKGIFNDTIKSSFNLAVITSPVWDTVYHPQDTILLPALFHSHSIVIESPIDFTPFASPYHFALLNLNGYVLKAGSHGNPSIMLTIDQGSN